MGPPSSPPRSSGSSTRCGTRLLLEVVAGIGQVEALVDHRKIRKDVAGYGVGEPLPVLEAGVRHLDAAEPSFPVRLDPVQALAAPPLGPAQGRGRRWQRVRQRA